MTNLKQLNLKALRVYVKAIVDCEVTEKDFIKLNKNDLLNWFGEFLNWNEVIELPSIETAICLDCLEVRQHDNYIFGKYNCPKCKSFVVDQ